VHQQPGRLDQASDPAAQRQLVAALARQLGGQLIETHISWVVLLPEIAYKFKKALRLAFLDYSTLRARRFFCEEELRLNRRLAPDLYLGVVRVCGTPELPVISKRGERGARGLALDYAVKMRAFAQSAIWDQRLREGLIAPWEIDQMADLLARFHRGAAPAPPETPWGNSALVLARTRADLAEIGALLADDQQRRLLAGLERWHEAQAALLAPAFERRKAFGAVRECHGDLHCANLLTLNDSVAAFDCIEFDDSMRWIDVLHDLAFAWMDLECHGRPDLAARLLNRYLQTTGDYAGLPVLRYYRIQRALVRCKVALLRPGGQQTAHAYLALAARAMHEGGAALIITHGLSGSGKSTLAAQLAEQLGALQIRADVERKRLYGIDPFTSAAASPATGIYDARASRASYRALARLARHAVCAGFTVIIDATFLSTQQRARFRRRACLWKVPFLILDVQAATATLEARIGARAQRLRDASDADLSVLRHQLATQEPLTNAEAVHVLTVYHETALARPALAALAERIGAAAGLAQNPIWRD
jgi:aminoglycoside phosphotransferase family enzyme/predicted kinase